MISTPDIASFGPFAEDYTATFMLGNLHWNTAVADYQEKKFYLEGNKEVLITYPALQSSDDYEQISYLIS